MLNINPGDKVILLPNKNLQKKWHNTVAYVINVTQSEVSNKIFIEAEPVSMNCTSFIISREFVRKIVV